MGSVGGRLTAHAAVVNSWTNVFRSERRFDSFPAPHDVFFESGRPVVDHRANAFLPIHTRFVSFVRRTGF